MVDEVERATRAEVERRRGTEKVTRAISVLRDHARTLAYSVLSEGSATQIDAILREAAGEAVKYARELTEASPLPEPGAHPALLEQKVHRMVVAFGPDVVDHPEAVVAEIKRQLADAAPRAAREEDEPWQHPAPRAALTGDRLADLHPGVRRLVPWLRELGYETIDSGDGGGPRAVRDEPHVSIAVAPAEMIITSMRLVRDLEAVGVKLHAIGETEWGGFSMPKELPLPCVQGTYDAVGLTAIVELLHVTDDMVEWDRASPATEPPPPEDRVATPADMFSANVGGCVASIDGGAPMNPRDLMGVLSAESGVTRHVSIRSMPEGRTYDEVAPPEDAPRRGFGDAVHASQVEVIAKGRSSGQPEGTDL